MTFLPRFLRRRAEVIPDTDLQMSMPTVREPHQASDREVTFQRMRAVVRSDRAMDELLRMAVGRE